MPNTNEAEQALGHAVIARRISFGTRTDEGSRFYAAALNVIDTCRKRGVEIWGYACRLIAAARRCFQAPYTDGLMLNDWFLPRPAKAIVTHHRGRHSRAARPTRRSKTAPYLGDVNGYVSSTFQSARALA